MAETKVAHAEIDWSSAEVADGKLTVALKGEPSKDWAERVEAIADRLQPSSRWKIEADAKQIAVGGVAPGAESDVRHFLESVLAQANADFAPDEDEDSGEGPSGEDAEMTEAFRSFADESDERD